MFIKEVSMDACDNEIELQNIAATYGFCPKIITTTKLNDKCFIMMEDLESDCLADIYGDEPSDIPAWIWDDIRKIVTTLFDEEGIEYRDITPYNFIEKNNKIYIIDFGDAKYTHRNKKIDWFLAEFMDGENSWNPDYK